jgi:hypothetical protein
MKNMRRHKRYGLDSIDVKGKMGLSDKVEILDISLGGVAFKVDRRLNPGREYMLKLHDKGRTLNVTGIIVRSELSGMEERGNEESVSIYSAGMQFKESSAVQIADFLESIVQNRKETEPSPVERRVNVRFQIIGPHEHILSYPAHFRVRTISLSGMLIQAEEALEIESKVPMELALNDGTSVNFIGRVVTCQMLEDKGQTHYEIGSEFADLTDEDKALLQTFIDQWAARVENVAGDSEQSEDRTQ